MANGRPAFRYLLDSTTLHWVPSDGEVREQKDHQKEQEVPKNEFSCVMTHPGLGMVAVEHRRG